MEIRKANPDDAEIVLEYLKQLRAERLNTIFRHEEMPNVEEERNFIGGKSGANGVVYICLESFRVIGLLSAGRKSPQQLSHSCDFGVSVLKEYRNKKIGTQLVKLLIEWANENNVQRVELSIIENNVAAMRLYKRLGFSEEGKKKGAVKIDNQYLDMIEMVKRVCLEK